MRKKAVKKAKLTDVPDYSKVDLLFHLKKVIQNINAKISGDKIIADYYGWTLRNGRTDNSDLIELKDQLSELMEEVYENW